MKIKKEKNNYWTSFLNKRNEHFLEPGKWILFFNYYDNFQYSRLRKKILEFMKIEELRKVTILNEHIACRERKIVLMFFMDLQKDSKQQIFNIGKKLQVYFNYFHSVHFKTNAQSKGKEKGKWLYEL